MKTKLEQENALLKQIVRKLAPYARPTLYEDSSRSYGGRAMACHGCGALQLYRSKKTKSGVFDPDTEEDERWVAHEKSCPTVRRIRALNAQLHAVGMKPISEQPR